MKKKWLGLIVLVFAVIGLMVIWLAGTFLTKPVPVQFKAIPQNAVQVEFSSQSGSTIHGWLYEAEQPTAIAALMHGVRSNRAQMTARAEHLQGLGISSLVFDFQSHGESVGEIITLGYLESLDAQAAVSFMSANNPDLPILVIGISMGGAAAIMSDPPLDIDALIVESVYPDINTAIANRLGSRIPGGQLLTPLLALQLKPRIGISADDLAPIRFAKKLTVPTLVLSGREDHRTTVKDTESLFQSFAGTKQLYLFDDVGHDDLERFDSKQYWNIVEPFLANHLE